MSKLAIIKTGGKQYKVKEADFIKVEKIQGKASENIIFDKVLLIGDSTKSSEVNIGTPYIKGTQVEATIIEQGRDKKVKVVKYKPKTRYKRVYGHRQPYTRVKIEKIST